MKRVLALSAAALLLAGPAFAQTGDTAPLDPRLLLEALKGLREQNESAIKSRRVSAYQRVAAAAASPESAVAFWKEAVKAAQFEGAENEGTQIRGWREGEGEALNDRLCANAARLHLNWLAINLQHAAGVETKSLLPKVLEHVAAVQAQNQAFEHFVDTLDKAKDRGTNSPGAKRSVQEDAVVKRVHEQILKASISNTSVSRWLVLGDVLGEKRKSAGAWEQVAGNVDGIYNTVILPEYRASKDPRLLEYWDMVLRREGERAAERKLDVEQREWTQVKRPALLWSRAQDVLLIGQRNRAISEMFNLVKTYPQHPEATAWIGQLESLVAPAAAPATAPSTTPVAVPPIPGGASVPAPVAVPPALPAASAPGVRVLPR